MTRGIQILLIEDDSDDAFFFTEAIRQSDLIDSPSVKLITNGRDAISYFKTSGAPADMIVLDLNLPLIDGFAVLSYLKQEKKVSTPVFVLTTSSRAEDRQKCEALGCDNFYSKPSAFKAYGELVSDMFLKAAESRSSQS
jgi:CheY-like chemotaxis protein